MIVFNRASRPFRVHILRVGAVYGFRDCLLNNDKEPLVEFYDIAAPTAIEPGGTFVQRYYLSTLVERSERYGFCGLPLWDDVPAWQLDGFAMVQVYRWLEWELGRELDAHSEQLAVLLKASPRSDQARVALAKLRKLDPQSNALARYAAALDSDAPNSSHEWLTLYSAELDSRKRIFSRTSNKSD